MIIAVSLSKGKQDEQNDKMEKFISIKALKQSIWTMIQDKITEPDTKVRL